MATLQHPFLPLPSNGNISGYLRDCHRFKIPQQPMELNNKLPEKLNSIIMRMIEKKPENRYSNVDVILEEIEVIEEKDKPDIPVELIEIAELAKVSEHKIKVENLKRAEEKERQEEESQNIKKIFDFHCEELLSIFEKVIDTINTKMEPIKIAKSRSSDLPVYKTMYSFHSLSLTIIIEQVDGVNEVEDVIGWGYCFINKYQDGFNLLLQKSNKESYAKWLAVEVQDHALSPRAKHLKPHAVSNLDALNDALRGLRATHIYHAKLQEFNESMFIDLVKKLVSQ
jgi:serine/threonine protein kinase